jgi:hypothetical protein
MTTVRQVTAWAGYMKSQTAWFLLNRVYICICVYKMPYLHVWQKVKTIPLEAWTCPVDSMNLRFPGIKKIDIESPTHRPLLPQVIFVVLIFVTGRVNSRTIVWPEGLRKWKIPIDTIGNRVHKLPACSMVPEPTVPPSAYHSWYSVILLCPCVCVNSDISSSVLLFRMFSICTSVVVLLWCVFICNKLFYICVYVYLCIMCTLRCIFIRVAIYYIWVNAYICISENTVLYLHPCCPCYVCVAVYIFIYAASFSV